MGFLDDDDVAKKDGKAWLLPSGWHTSTVQKVDIAKSTLGELAIYEVSCQPAFDTPGAPTPLDVPQVKLSLDCNDPKQNRAMVQIFGTPRVDGAQVMWSGDGQIQWDGVTGATGRFVGKLDVLVESVEGRPREKGGGYWPHTYKVKNIAPAGEALRKANEAARKMAESITKPAGEPAAVTTQAAAATTRGRRS